MGARERLSAGEREVEVFILASRRSASASISWPEIDGGRGHTQQLACLEEDKGQFADNPLVFPGSVTDWS